MLSLTSNRKCTFILPVSQHFIPGILNTTVNSLRITRIPHNKHTAQGDKYLVNMLPGKILLFLLMQYILYIMLWSRNGVKAT